MQLAKLTDDEMSAVNNLEFLGVQAPKKQTSGVEKFALKFGARKVCRTFHGDRAATMFST